MQQSRSFIGFELREFTALRVRVQVCAGPDVPVSSEVLEHVVGSAASKGCPRSPYVAYCQQQRDSAWCSAGALPILNATDKTL